MPSNSSLLPGRARGGVPGLRAGWQQARPRWVQTSKNPKYQTSIPYAGQGKPLDLRPRARRSTPNPLSMLGRVPDISMHSGVKSQIGQTQPFLPSWLTAQTQNQLLAQGAQQANAAGMLPGVVGRRGISGNSGIVHQKLLQQQAPIYQQAAQGAAEVGLQDPLERSKFATEHALAQQQDIISGRANRMARDALKLQNYGQQQNLLLSLLQSGLR